MIRPSATLALALTIELGSCTPQPQIVVDFSDGRAAVHGRVTDAETGEAIPGAVVVIGWSYHAYADANGRYAMGGLRPGPYESKFFIAGSLPTRCKSRSTMVRRNEISL